MNSKDIAQLFRQFGGQQNTLVIPRPYITLVGGDILAALLLSQIVYWSDRTQDPDGWIAHSYQEWTDELGMSEYQVRRATKVLADFGVETKLRRSMFHEGAATLHYRLLTDRFAEQIERVFRTGSEETQERGSEVPSERRSAETSERLNTEPISEPISNTTTGSRSEIVQVYEQEIGQLSPFVADELKDAMTEYPHDWIVEAIRLAALQNKRFWKYALGILKRWKADGKTGGKASSAPAAYDPGAQYSTETTFVKIPGRSDE